MTIHVPRAACRTLMLLVLLGSSGCAMVNVKHVTTRANVTQRRVDVLDNHALSDNTVQALNVVALTAKTCVRAFTTCSDTLTHSPGLDDEQRLSALAELWLQKAINLNRAPANALTSDATLDAFLQSARYAYAYLFYTARKPTDRTFEMRQVQVIDFYNFAAQHAVVRLFEVLPKQQMPWSDIPMAGWTILKPQMDLRLAGDAFIPSELIPASALRFQGLRNVYMRDGFGSDFVAVTAPDPSSDTPWREPEYTSLSSALLFDGTALADVLATRQVRLLADDPYRDSSITLAGRRVPLAANFTAAYGVWLARSGFAKQSIQSLLGRQGGITTPRILMMQPYDPNRLTVVMLHGLASSPEAWLNVSNEVMGDEELRRNYQVWEVYYPTNLPVPLNLASIRKALDATLHHFDPSGRARASQNMVLVGHSMGGLIARLLVSSSGDKLWSAVPVRTDLSAAKQAKLRQKLSPYLTFTPMPQVTRAVFLAAPHRGTPYAHQWIARLFSDIIRLPSTLLAGVSGMTDLLVDAANGKPLRLPNAIGNLSDTDPFVKAAADLPISPRVHYHTIVGVYKSDGPLASSSDGVVPYWSAHLAGADSELAVPSWHTVQNKPAAILELRRILRLQIEATASAR